MSASTQHALIYRSFGAGRKPPIIQYFTFTKTLGTWVLGTRGTHLPIKLFYVALEQTLFFVSFRFYL